MTDYSRLLNARTGEERQRELDRIAQDASASMETPTLDRLLGASQRPDGLTLEQVRAMMQESLQSPALDRLEARPPPRAPGLTEQARLPAPPRAPGAREGAMGLSAPAPARGTTKNGKQRVFGITPRAAAAPAAAPAAPAPHPGVEALPPVRRATHNIRRAARAEEAPVRDLGELPEMQLEVGEDPSAIAARRREAQAAARQRDAVRAHPEVTAEEVRALMERTGERPETGGPGLSREDLSRATLTRHDREMFSPYASRASEAKEHLRRIDELTDEEIQSVMDRLGISPEEFQGEPGTGRGTDYEVVREILRRYAAQRMPEQVFDRWGGNP